MFNLLLRIRSENERYSTIGKEKKKIFLEDSFSSFSLLKIPTLLSLVFYDALSSQPCNYLFLIPGSLEELSPPFLSPSARLVRLRHADAECCIVLRRSKSLTGICGKRGADF